MIKPTDLAYAAGYFDGDGCFSIGKVNCIAEKRVRYRDMIIINSTEIESLQWFQRIFGGVLSINKKSNSTHKPLIRYVLKGNNLNFFNQIQSYLVEKIDEFHIFEKFKFSICKIEKEALIDEMHRLKEFNNLIPTSIKEQVEIIRNSIIPSEEDFAYLAGFIDAECCLNIQKSYVKGKPNATYKIQLQCNNTKSPCFYWLSARFGGQFHFIDRSKFKTPHRNQMTWRLTSAALSNILEKINPFLIHKKAVCEQLINFYKTTIPLHGCISRNSKNFASFYEPILKQREEIFHKIQSLNKKGI